MTYTEFIKDADKKLFTTIYIFVFGKDEELIYSQMYGIEIPQMLKALKEDQPNKENMKQLYKQYPNGIPSTYWTAELTPSLLIWEKKIREHEKTHNTTRKNIKNKKSTTKKEYIETEKKGFMIAYEQFKKTLDKPTVKLIKKNKKEDLPSIIKTNNARQCFKLECIQKRINSGYKLDGRQIYYMHQIIEIWINVFKYEIRKWQKQLNK